LSKYETLPPNTLPAWQQALPKHKLHPESTSHGSRLIGTNLCCNIASMLLVVMTTSHLYRPHGGMAHGMGGTLVNSHTRLVTTPIPPRGVHHRPGIHPSHLVPHLVQLSDQLERHHGIPHSPRTWVRQSATYLCANRAPRTVVPLHSKVLRKSRQRTIYQTT